MDLRICGPTYQHPSQDVNFQKCINLFPSYAGRDGVSGSPINNNTATPVLLHTPGYKELIDLGINDEVRAIMVYDDDNVYTVVGTSVYKITINTDAETATSTLLGTVAGGDGQISWAKNPTQIMMVMGTKGYIITVSTDTLTEITDTDFTGGDTVVFLDSYFIYNTPDAATMYVTSLNDGSTVDPTDVATAEGQPDDTVALLVDKRELWVLGENSVEIWYNAANATGFPLSRRDGAVLDVGCSAKFSAIRIDNTLMWLDDQGYVVQSNGYQVSPVSSPAVNAAIQGYETWSDAFAYETFDRGHNFYVLTFPTENKTWVYDLTTQLWHERAYFNQDDEFERHHSNCHARYKNLNLIGDSSTGKIHIMRDDIYDDDGDPIHRLRTTQHNQNEYKQFGVPELELHVEAGKGLTTGTGSDPKIMMRYSHDGGYSWSHELERSIGKIGQYGKRVRWNRLGTGREWLFEFRYSDPTKFTLISASVEVDGDGNA